MSAGSWFLSGWLSHAELVALGWTLLHFCWQGTAVAVAYTLLDRMTARAAAPVRYAAALLALAMMPVAVALTFTDQLHTARLQIANPAQAVAVTLPATFAQSPEPVLSQGPQQVLQAATNFALESTFAAHETLAARAEWAMPYVDALWLMGMLLLSARALGGWWQLHQVRRRARGLVPPAVQQAFERVCERLRAGERVALRISDEVISPLAMGVWRATVILPVSAVVRLPMDELEAVLAHELGHIQRWDYLCNLFQTAIESVLFFHPSVWWLSRIVRERRELCCDAIAARSCADPVIYARALLQLEEHRTQRLELPLAMAIDGCGTSLLSRIKQVLGEDTPMESRMTSGVRVAAAAGVVMALLLSSKVSTALAAPMAQSVVQESAPAAVAQPLPKAEFQPVSAPAQPAPVATPAPAPQAMVSPVATPATSSSTTSSTTSHAKSGTTSTTTTTTTSRTVYDPLLNDVATALDEAMPALVSYNSQGMMQLAKLQPMLAQMDARMKSDPAMPKGMAYLDQMRAAGYDFDLDKDLDSILALKSLGVTPDYAKAMASLGLGKPSVHELTKLKALGVTPEYVEKLKQSGMMAKDFHELSTDKALGITPEYAAAMRQKGFVDLTQHDLVTLKAQGITPEYAGWLKQQFPQSTVSELRKLAVFHFDDKFLAAAKAHGYDTNDLGKLLKLKMSGLLDE